MSHPMRGVREGVPDTEADYEKSLFRVVDAREVEATVLRNAEKYARELSIPSFMGPKRLGFGPEALGNFCSDVDTLVLRMAADAARNEGRELRESGVTNLAARDRVQIKEQILQGLLRQRTVNGEETAISDVHRSIDEAHFASAAHPSATTTMEEYQGMNEGRQHRANLMRAGAVTPFDITDDSKIATPSYDRTFLPDQELVERMESELPHTRHEHVHEAQTREDPRRSDGVPIDREQRTRVDVGTSAYEGAVVGARIQDSKNVIGRDLRTRAGQGERNAGQLRQKMEHDAGDSPTSQRPSSKENRRRLSVASQGLVDDFEDADFEVRKEQIKHASRPTEEGPEASEPAGSDTLLGDGLIIDRVVSHRLFQFQLTGVRWMWQLFKQGAGGIVGDEMGLGKTVQVASFLGALHGSSLVRHALVLCPATVLSQWVEELHTWAPKLRVVLFHRCAQAFNSVFGRPGRLRTLIRRVLGFRDVVVVTSYEGMKSLKAFLLPCNWDYCVLDEGQRIRNPDAEVTLLCKQIRTVHRLVLTGTPIQNNLRELWSLFDFIFPGRLGTLPAFEREFATPIRVGGYTNASPMQVRLAYRCALVLRDLIQPYLLRRLKKDLEDVIRLPQKTEQVLFCRLTSYQRGLYSEFIESAEVKAVLSRNKHAFRAIGVLRKLCNHPDLVCRFGESIVNRLGHLASSAEGGDDSRDKDSDPILDISSPEASPLKRSGKLLVLRQILPLWHKQTRLMLTIIEHFVKNMRWAYGRLDGNTPVGTRQQLIDRFNADDSFFIMLLTTRTGGVGTNLTGADRVILFDPDWNPSTDMQARERSWRVGQRRQVTVYRLITAGTIEEKIYHRQIFKTALTNRVLQNPKQKRIFSADELGDLFTLGDDGSMDGFTDTVDLFQGEGMVDDPKKLGGSSSKGRPAGGQMGHHTTSERSHIKSQDKAGIGVETESLTPEESPLLGSATVVVESKDERDSLGSGSDRGGDRSKNDDSAVLQALYDGAPLSSVFHHEVAEAGGSKGASAEQKWMEEAAKRAAQRAVDQLRMSRRTLRAGAGQGGFQSSWTGRNGGAESSPEISHGHRSRSGKSTGRRFGNVSVPGATDGSSSQIQSKQEDDTTMEQNSFFDQDKGTESGDGLKSKEILRQIRLRGRSQPAPSGLFPELQDSAASEDKDAQYAALLQRLQDYLAQASGGVDTAALIHEFGDLPRADVPVFRQMLQSIAICANGEWTLRDAFGNI